MGEFAYARSIPKSHELAQYITQTNAVPLIQNSFKIQANNAPHFY